MLRLLGILLFCSRNVRTENVSVLKINTQWVIILEQIQFLLYHYSNVSAGFRLFLNSVEKHLKISFSVDYGLIYLYYSIHVFLLLFHYYYISSSFHPKYKATSIIFTLKSLVKLVVFWVLQYIENRKNKIFS